MSPSVSIVINQIIAAQRGLDYLQQSVGLLSHSERALLRPDLDVLRFRMTQINKVAAPPVAVTRQHSEVNFEICGN